MAGSVPLIAPWASPFIGIPFVHGGRTRDGIDCYGLCVLVFTEVFKIDLPAYALDWSSRADWPRLTEAIEQGRRDWEPIPRAAVTIGDAVLLAIAGAPLHVGIIAGTDPLRMLHAEQGINTCLERLDSIVWARRIAGFYRWRGRA